ncbi:MAG: hypothetical protein AAGA70_04320 [Pseudomonadota bacterium]
MAGFVAVFALTGCQLFAPFQSTVLRTTGPSFDAGGIQPPNTDLRIDFGRAQPGVIEAASRLFGAAPDEVIIQTECGAGTVTAARWPGVTLNFLDGDFRGWVVAAPGLPAGGLTVGTPRDALPPLRYQETTLGTEFDAGGVFGIILPGEDEVAQLWSGATCFFR